MYTTTSCLSKLDTNKKNNRLKLVGDFYGEPFVSKWLYKILCVGAPNWKDKSTRFVLSTRLSTSSGKDRLDQSGLASIPGSWEEFLRRPEIKAIYSCTLV